jgi:hypothetical protein
MNVISNSKACISGNRKSEPYRMRQTTCSGHPRKYWIGLRHVPNLVCQVKGQEIAGWWSERQEKVGTEGDQEKAESDGVIGERWRDSGKEMPKWQETFWAERTEGRCLYWCPKNYLQRMTNWRKFTYDSATRRLPTASHWSHEVEERSNIAKTSRAGAKSQEKCPDCSTEGTRSRNRTQAIVKPIHVKTLSHRESWQKQEAKGCSEK